MSQSPFRSIFIPSMLAAGAVFAAVTLPLSLNRSIPRWVALGSLQRQSIPVPERSTKPVIRYIGLSIVVSVGAGVATIELLRRWQKRPPNRAADLAFAPEDVPKSVADSPVTTVNGPMADEPSFEVLLAHAAKVSGEFTAQNIAARQGCVPVAQAFQSHPVGPLVSATPNEPTNQFEYLSFPDQVSPVHVSLPAPTDPLPASTGAPLDAGNSQGQVAFAIAYRHSFYCLVRSTPHSAVAQQWAQQFSDQSIDFVLSQQDGLFAIWRHQPAAVPVGDSSLNNLTVLSQRAAINSLPQSLAS
ncbi:MAG: hypothetical protein AAFN18_02940 [Cyanobacteria bacterium J06554_6]